MAAQKEKCNRPKRERKKKRKKEAKKEKKKEREKHVPRYNHDISSIT